MHEWTIGESAETPTPQDLVRHLRGAIYLARMHVRRLEGAWPDPDERNEHQRRAIAQARSNLASLYIRARQEGVRPWRRATPLTSQS